MKTRLIATALAAALFATAAPAHDLYEGGRQPHSHGQNTGHAHPNTNVVTQQIRINCFRGPIRETVWDHARADFIDDLVLFGYEYTDALAIATRVCRDVTAVGNPDALRANLLKAIQMTPPLTKKRH